MKKKIFIILSFIFMLMVIPACGNKVFSNKLEEEDLSIDDFDWETKKTYINGNKCYAFSLTNNSEYDVLSVYLQYKTKDNLTEYKLAVYENFMKEHEGFIEEDDPLEGVTLNGKQEKLIKKGETTEPIKLKIGYEDTYWSASPNETQFNLMEPSTMEISIIGKDNFVYIAYYDFIDETWYIDEISKEINKLPKTELAKKVVKPKCEYFLLTSDLDDEKNISFVAYGISKEYFKEYIKTIQEKGFEVDSGDDFDSYYIDYGENKDADRISIHYKKADEKMTISLRKD